MPWQIRERNMGVDCHCGDEPGTRYETPDVVLARWATRTRNEVGSRWVRWREPVPDDYVSTEGEGT